MVQKCLFLEASPISELSFGRFLKSLTVKYFFNPVKVGSNQNS